MVSLMDEALRRTNEAVERYEVPQKVIAVAAQCLESMSADARHETEVEALVDANLQVAASHGGPHPDCMTCQRIKNALAVSMGVVRAETDLALSRMYGDS